MNIIHKNEIYFPANINQVSEEINYIISTIHELESLPFHDDRLNTKKPFVCSKKLSQLEDQLNVKPVSYIFHTAFCGSTFMSKLLGKLNNCLSIREPQVLMEVANFIRVESKLYNNPRLTIQWLKSILNSFYLMSINSQLIVKPTNVSNNIIGPLLNASPNSKALLLYTDLDDFLISILKKGESGRMFVRHLYNVLSLDGSAFASTDFRMINKFTDLQIACMVWSMQMSAYNSIIKEGVSNNIKFLNADNFLNNPKLSIINIANHLGIRECEDEFRTFEKDGVFSKHAKFNNQKYNTQIREEEKVSIRNKYEKEFVEIHIWLKQCLKLPSLPNQDLCLKLCY